MFLQIKNNQIYFFKSLQIFCPLLFAMDAVAEIWVTTSFTVLHDFVMVGPYQILQFGDLLVHYSNNLMSSFHPVPTCHLHLKLLFHKSLASEALFLLLTFTVFTISISLCCEFLYSRGAQPVGRIWPFEVVCAAPTAIWKINVMWSTKPY